MKRGILTYLQPVISAPKPMLYIGKCHRSTGRNTVEDSLAPGRKVMVGKGTVNGWLEIGGCGGKRGNRGPCLAEGRLTLGCCHGDFHELVV